ncbi:hypothetical protein IJ579_03720 [bacterium]|nr:hypothetical protein [bacterium]
MARLIIFLDKLVNLYLYFVVMACFLGLVPNINPNYPLFHYIFKFAGFFIIPPIFGMYLSPALIMVTTVLISTGLRKIHNKYFESKKPEIIIMSPAEFMDTMNRAAARMDKFKKESSETSDDRKDDLND